MIPAVDNAHVTEGAALLTSRYKNAAVVQGLVQALMLKFQEKENEFQLFLTAVNLANHPLAGGPWNILDQFAALVGVPGGRLARSDADLLQAIKIQIRVNRSHGLAEDIVQIVALVVAGAVYYDWPLAAWEVDVFNTTSSIVAALVTYLGKARTGGVAANLRYTTFAGPYIKWGSSYGGVTGAGFASTYGGAPLDKLAALAPIV